MTAGTNPPPDRIRLRDVMLRRYLRLGESHTLTEVLGFLTDPHFAKDGLPFLVVIGTDGSLAGLLPPRAIFRALLGDAGADAHEDEFLRGAAGHLNKTTGEVMERNVPVLPPDAFVEDALALIATTPAGVVGVAEDGRVIGLITARSLFETAAKLTVGALSGGVIPAQPAPARKGLRH